MIDLNAYYRVLHPDWDGSTLPVFTGEDVKVMAIVETITPPQHDFINRLIDKDRIEYDNSNDTTAMILPMRRMEVFTVYSDISTAVAITTTDKVHSILNDPGGFDLLLTSNFSKMLQLVRLLCVSSKINTVSEYRQSRLHQFWNTYFDRISNSDMDRKIELIDGFRLTHLEYQNIADNINTLIRVGDIDHSVLLKRVDNLVTVRDI